MGQLAMYALGDAVNAAQITPVCNRNAEVIQAAVIFVDQSVDGQLGLVLSILRFDPVY